MKSTLKLLMIVVLFCGTALADDGDMGGGGGFAPPADPPEAGTIEASDALLVYVSEFVISVLR